MSNLKVASKFIKHVACEHCGSSDYFTFSEKYANI